MGLLTFVTMSGMFLLPFFLQLVKGYPPHYIGFLMMVTPLMMGVVAPLSGILSDRFGTRGISVLGLLIVVCGCLSVSTLNSQVGPLGYILRTAPFGIGMGVFQSPNNSAVMGAVPPERLGVASGLLALTRNLGHTTGLPLMGALFTAHILSFSGLERLEDISSVPAEALVHGVTGTFQIGASIIFLSLLLGVAALRVSKKLRGGGSQQN
jgi:MFS family permease